MPDANRLLSDGKVAALRLLQQALEDADDLKKESWQFAVRKAELLASGANASDLRWLISRALARQARETTQRGDAERQFEKLESLDLPDEASFVLTYGGTLYVKRIGVQANRGGCPPVARQSAKRRRRRGGFVAQATDAAHCDANGPAAVPDWRPKEGELHFRGELVRRRGRKSARFEELLLARFAAAGWARSVVNPFEDAAEARQQLTEAVRRLNNSLLRGTLRFHVNENGAIACWEDSVMLGGTRFALPAQASTETGGQRINHKKTIAVRRARGNNVER